MLFYISLKANSSVGRVAVSKTVGRGFESYFACHKLHIFVEFFVIKNFLIFCFCFKIGVKIGVKKCVLKYIYFKCFLSSSYCIIFEFYFWLNFHQCPCKCPLLIQLKNDLTIAEHILLEFQLQNN